MADNFDGETFGSRTKWGLEWQEAGSMEPINFTKDDAIALYWKIAITPPEETRGSIRGKSMLVETWIGTLDTTQPGRDLASWQTSMLPEPKGTDVARKRRQNYLNASYLR